MKNRSTTKEMAQSKFNFAMSKDSFSQTINLFGKSVLTILIVLLGFAPMLHAQTFTQGNLAVLQINGTGSNNGGSIIELNPSAFQASPVNTFAIPSTSGSNSMRFGVAATTGAAANSDDGTLFCVIGANSITTSGNYNLLLPRGVGTINKAYSFSSPNLAATYTESTSGNQVRGATTTDNVHYYESDQSGMFTNGGTAPGYVANLKGVKSFGGIAYVASASAPSVAVIASPTATTVTGLNGVPTLAALEDFYMLSSGTYLGSPSTYDMLYVISATSATAGTINKYTLISGTWTAEGTAYTTTFGGFGIAAAFVNGVNSTGGVYLYVTSGQASFPNSVIRLTDAGAYNAALSITTGNNVTLFTGTASQCLKGIGFAPVTPALTLSAAQPTASSISVGSSDNIIGGIQLTETNTYTTLAGVSLTTAGTYVSGDITNLKLWLSNSATSIVGATQLGATQAAVGNGGTLAVSGLITKIPVGTQYILATASIAGGATLGNTLSIATTSSTPLTFTSANTPTVTGAPVAGGTSPTNDQTIAALVPTIVLSNGTISSGSINQNTTNNVLYQAIATVSVTSATLNSASFTTTGTYQASDITNLKLWFSTSSTFSTGTAVNISTLTSGLGAGTQTFSGLTQSISVGTGYLYVTADVPCGTAGNAINVNAISAGSLTFATGTPTGSTFTAGGAQTIAGITPSDVTANAASPNGLSGQVNVSWTNPSSGCWNDIMIVVAPASNTGTPTGDGSAYTANLAYGTGTALGNGFVAYRGTTSPETVTGLTDGTPYFYKVFVRNGTVWSAGVEVSATSYPIIYNNTFTGASTCPTQGNVPTVVANALGRPMTRSSITCNTGAGSANVFNSTNINASAVINYGSYAQFTATANAGYQLNVSGISFQAAANSTGPNQMDVQYSLSGFHNDSTDWGACPNSLAVASIGTNVWNTSPFPVSTLAGDSITFRFYPYGTQNPTGGASASSGTVRFTNVELLGTVDLVPVPTVAFAAAQPSAANIEQGSNNNIIGAISMGVTAANAYLQGVTVNTAGTYISSDISSNGFGVWLSSSPTSISGAVQLGTNQAAVSSGGAISVSGFTNNITNGTTAYIVVTANISPSATTGHTISLGSTVFSNFTFNSVNPTGTNPVPGGVSPTNDQTIILAVPTIALSNSTVSAGSIQQSSVDNVLYQTNVTVGNTSAILNSASFTTSGTYSSSEITNLKLWYSTSSSFSTSTADSIGVITSSLGGGSHTFSSLSQLFPIGTGYLFVTTDVNCTATIGHNIKVNAITTGGFTFFSGTPTGSGFTNGGLQTFSAATLQDATTLSAAPTGNSGQLLVTWTPPAGCYNQVMVVVTPNTSNTGTPSGNGSAYTGDVNSPYGTTFGNGNVVYIGAATGSPITITGLTNGTAYFVKIFTNFGTNWSSGYEVFSIPAVFPLITDVVMPQYIEGATPTNVDRMPFACLLTITNLTASASYNYFPGIVLGTDVSSYTGAGNAIYAYTSGFIRSSSPAITGAGNFGTFTADATGAYTGWFIVEPTGSARLTPGNQVFIRINLNDGAGGTSVISQPTTTESAAAVSFGNSVNATSCTGLYGLSQALPKNFVVTYDNTAGTGRAIAASFVETAGETVTANYAPFYAADVLGVNGAYGTIIPNSNSNGIQRIEQRDIVTGNIVGCPSTNSTGIWSSGANTVNPTGGTTPIEILSSDAPLPIVTVGASVAPYATVCAGTLVTLTGSGATTYSWTSGVTDGVPFAATTTTTYTVTGTYLGCSNTATQTVTVMPLPIVGVSVSPNATVCSGTLVTLSGTGAAGYSWSGGVTDGTPFTANTTTTYTVTGTGLGCTNTATETITVNPLPTGISAYQVVCNGSHANLGLISNIAGSSFTWTSTVTSGAVNGNSTCSSACGSSITDLLTNTGAVHGVVQYTVIPSSPAGCTGASFIDSIRVGATPATPGAIAGPNAVCGLTSAIYSVTPVAEASSYIWTVFSPMTITSGQGTNTIHITVPAGTVIGNITVSAYNSCGTSGVSTLAITKKPSAAGAITGPTAICGITSPTFTIVPVSGATSYTWVVPTGMTVTNGAGTTQITTSVTGTFVSGTISVSAVNACGSVPGTSLVVYQKQEPGLITGNSVICGTISQTYSIAAVPGAASYLWGVATGMAITSGAGTTSITASVPTANNGYIPAGQGIKVAAINTCGASAYRVLALTACASAIGMNNTFADVATNNYSEIYPNPTTQEFSIDVTTDADKNVTVEVYNVLGNLVVRESHAITSGIVNTMKTNIETFKNGMYFVRLTDENGNVLNTQRVVKQ